MTDEDLQAKGLPPRGEIVDVDVLEEEMDVYVARFKAEVDAVKPGRADPRKLSLHRDICVYILV